jgi:hemerythrin-like domain-containing protein
MMPVGLLMIEHRFIERMVGLMNAEIGKIKKENKADVAFIDTALDFLKVYADRCHHGKEEDILFRGLSGKKISTEHRNIMEGLLQEHVYGRKMAKCLAQAKEKYASGSKPALKEIADAMAKLTEFYPRHIEKEDKHFFLPCMGYFSKQEQASMLKDFADFDQRLIHEKYKAVIEEAEKRK